MKRELSQAEMSTAQKIADAIGVLDKLVFPEDPIKKIVVVQGKPKIKSRAWVSYVSSDKTEDGVDFYQIYGYGLDKCVEKAIDTTRVMLFQSKEKKLTRWEDSPKISEQELIVSWAVHEVRHRVQDHFRSDELFSPDLGIIKNPRIREVIKFIRIMFRIRPPEGDYKLEFDATVVEYIIREMWHRGKRNPRYIASLIKTGARYNQFRLQNS